jgi:EmrB/QacA subfamily drug resistance transporter
MFITLLDASIVNVALPSISRSTGAGPSELQWVVSGYVLAFSMVPIIAGRLGDDRGRRFMLLIGIAAFGVTSALVGLAPSAGILIAARVLQGVAGGLLNPQVSGLIQQLFPPKERGKAFGTLGAVIGLSNATGPVVGGAIIGLGGTEYGWRLTFLLNVPVTVAAFLLCRAWLPRLPKRSGAPRPLDIFGATLLSLATLCVLLPPIEYDAVRDARLALLWIPAALFLFAFIAWERGPARERGFALIDISLFKIRSFAGGLGISGLYLCAFVGLPLVLALYLQEGLGYSPLRSGMTASAFAVGVAISGPLTGRVIVRYGRALLIAALVVFFIGVLTAALIVHLAAGSVSNGTIGWILIPALFVAGLGGGGVVTPNMTLSLADVDARGGSTAGGMLQTSQRIGSSIGSAVLSAVFYAHVRGHTATVGVERAKVYGGAYTLALLVAVGIGLMSLLLAILDVRRSRALKRAAAR